MSNSNARAGGRRTLATTALAAATVLALTTAVVVACGGKPSETFAHITEAWSKSNAPARLEVDFERDFYEYRTRVSLTSARCLRCKGSRRSRRTATGLWTFHRSRI